MASFLSLAVAVSLLASPFSSHPLYDREVK